MKTVKRICQDCGKEFNGTVETGLCPACRKKRRQETVLKDRICRSCGVAFKGGPRAWYCPNCRAARQKEADQRRKKSGVNRPLGSIDYCLTCGKEYVVEGGQQKYCKDCAAETVKMNTRPKKREYNQKNKEKLEPLKNELRKQQHYCWICGTEIPRNRSLCDSEQCRERALYISRAKTDYKRGRRKTPPPEK